jgi:GNAT superfamily N-acetyltransferase
MFTFRINGLPHPLWQIVSGFRIWSLTRRFNHADKAWRDACTALEVSQIQVMGAKLRALDFKKKLGKRGRFLTLKWIWLSPNVAFGTLSHNEMITYTHTTIRKLSARRRDRLYQLCFSNGMMRELVRDNEANVSVVLALDSGTIIGWSFLRRGIIGCYVEPTYRRGGIGKSLVNRLRTGTRKNATVSLHNHAARRFYGKLGAAYDTSHPLNGEWILNGKLAI